MTRTEKIAVGAHYGLGDWLSQRVTAVVIALYTLLLIGLLMWQGGVDHTAWRALFASGVFRVVSFLFLVAVYYHAWVGMRNVLMDYVKPTGVRLALEALVVCTLVGYTGWAIHILWGLS